MLSKMGNQKKRVCFLSLMSVVGIFVLVSSGCEPLKKKFTRKAKDKKTSSEFIPILEPVDYTSNEGATREKYQYYYSVWSLWQKELYQSLDGAHRKRVVHLANKILEALQKMRIYTPEAKQIELDQEIEGAFKILKKVDVPDMFRQEDILKRDLRDHESSVKNNFKPSVIYGEIL